MPIVPLLCQQCIFWSTFFFKKKNYRCFFVATIGLPCLLVQVFVGVVVVFVVVWNSFYLAFLKNPYNVIQMKKKKTDKLVYLPTST